MPFEGEKFEKPPEAKIEEKEEKKELKPLSKGAFNRLREYAGPPVENIAERMEFERQFKDLSPEEQEAIKKEIEELDERRKAEIEKYEWLYPTDKIEALMDNPEEHDRREEVMKAEWDKLSPKEKEKKKARLWKLRFYQYPELWEEKKEK